MMEEAMTNKDAVLADLRREVGRIAGGGGAWQDITKPTDYRAFTPAPKDARLKVEGRATAPAEGPFGRWLVRQPEEGLPAALVRAARVDRQFPPHKGHSGRKLARPKPASRSSPCR